MDLEEARALVRTQHRAVLATWRPDGTPQLSPVTAGVDEDGYLVISTRDTAYKVRNLRRDPRAYLCLFPDSFFGGRWAQKKTQVRARVAAQVTHLVRGIP